MTDTTNLKNTAETATDPNLPSEIDEVFSLMDSSNKGRVVELFTSDAVVADDGQTYRGRDAIIGWLDGPASQFTTTSTRLSLERIELATVVTTLLEGDFPGGRVELRYEFEQLTDGLITARNITA